MVNVILDCKIKLPKNDHKTLNLIEIEIEKDLQNFSQNLSDKINRILQQRRNRVRIFQNEN